MIIKDIRPDLYREGYNIGFFDAKYLFMSDKERNRKVHWLDKNGYKKGWFADPFFLDMDDKYYYILAEEFVYADNKGRLVKISVDRNNYKLASVNVILELDTHLSFPIYFDEEGIIYVYPENYQSGGVNVYTYDEKQSKLNFVKRIIDEPLLDTQIFKIENKYYAFGVKWETNSQDDTKKLMVFESSSFLGPYTHIQTIFNNKKEERGAGMIYFSSNAIFRPAQCCEGGYGKAVILYRLDMKSGKFMEYEEQRFRPNVRSQYGKVLHTLNIMNNVCVIDGYGFDHPFVMKIVGFIKRIARK